MHTEYHDICIRVGASQGYKIENYSDQLCVGVGSRMAECGPKISMNQAWVISLVTIWVKREICERQFTPFTLILSEKIVNFSHRVLGPKLIYLQKSP